MSSASSPTRPIRSVERWPMPAPTGCSVSRRRPSWSCRRSPLPRPTSPMAGRFRCTAPRRNRCSTPPSPDRDAGLVEARFGPCDAMRPDCSRSRRHQPDGAEIPGDPMTRLAALRLVDPSRYVVYLGFLLILAVFSGVLREDGFLTTGNLLNIVQQTTPITVMAVGMVFVLAAGEIDLSIGSVVALSALVTAVVLRQHSIMLGILAGLGTGAAIGLVNGLFVTRLRLPSFLVTLAPLSLVAGLSPTLTHLHTVPATNT